MRREDLEGLGYGATDAPDALGIHVGVSDVHVRGAGSQALFTDDIVVVLDLLLVRAIDGDEQHGAGVGAGEALVEVFAGRREGQSVHELDGGRDDAALGHDFRHGGDRFVDRFEETEHVHRRLGQR